MDARIGESALGTAPGHVAMAQRFQIFLSFQDKSEILIFYVKSYF